MVECLTRYRWVAGSSLTWSTALCSWTWHFILCAVLVSPRWSRGDIVLASAVCPPFCQPACLSTCPSRNISKYLLVIVDAFSVWMDSTMDSPISYKFRQDQLIKTGNYNAQAVMAFLEWWSKHFPKVFMYKKPVDEYDGVKTLPRLRGWGQKVKTLFFWNQSCWRSE